MDTLWDCRNNLAVNQLQHIISVMWDQRNPKFLGFGIGGLPIKFEIYFPPDWDVQRGCVLVVTGTPLNK
jgi:hypothetical protein